MMLFVIAVSMAANFGNGVRKLVPLERLSATGPCCASSEVITALRKATVATLGLQVFRPASSFPRQSSKRGTSYVQLQVQTCLQLLELVADVLGQALQQAAAVFLSLAALRMVTAVTLQLVPWASMLSWLNCT